MPHYCHDDLRRGGARQGCPECLTWHHAECLADHGRCASCDAPSSLVVPQAALERAVEDALSRREDGCLLQGCNRARAVQGHCRKHAPQLIRQTRLVGHLLLGFSAFVSLLLPLTFEAGASASEVISQIAVLGTMAGLGLWLGFTFRKSAHTSQEELDRLDA